MKNINAKKLSLNILKNGVSVVIGSFLCAFALYSFIIPNQFVSGGIGGIATILENAGIVKAYISQLAINIPLLIAALIGLRKDFAVKTIACSVLISVFLGLMDTLSFMKFTEDRLLAALYSGIIYGLALGILFECGSSSGGSEVIANLIVKKRPSTRIAFLILIMDIIVILAGLTIFDYWSVAYAVVCSVACEKAMDFYLARGKFAGAYYFITNKPDKISTAINKNYKREGILIPTTYNQENGNSIIQVLLPAGNVNKVKHIVEKEDNDAFCFVIPSSGELKEIRK